VDKDLLDEGEGAEDEDQDKGDNEDGAQGEMEAIYGIPGADDPPDQGEQAFMLP
ncbi:hypothetical protein FRC11_001591, partial [Ceratobasidium sp. 423]